jgi:uncharacterized protein YndB with AHSA1/START domain
MTGRTSRDRTRSGPVGTIGSGDGSGYRSATANVSSTLSGYLVIADISGYSSYLATTELEHSPQVLTELLELIVDHMAPPLRLSKFEGDAVFLHGPDDTFHRGETLLEVIEETYASFRDRIRSIERNLCDCEACRKSPTLDLKFVVHRGEYRTHVVAGHEELVGKDVALVHRLLKNGVAEATGWRGYALFTEQAIGGIGVRPDGVHRSTERFDLGAVSTVSIDLDGRYLDLVDARRVVVSPAEADLSLARTLTAPPAVVWEWLNDPERRLQWEAVAVDPKVLPGGRSGPGEVSHCVVGQDLRILTVLDWRPFEYFTVQATEPPAQGETLTTYRLAPTDGVTRLTVSVRLGAKGLKRRFARQAAEKSLGASLDVLVQAVETETRPAAGSPTG